MVRKKAGALAARQPENLWVDPTPSRPRGRSEVIRAVFSAMHRLYAESGDVSIRAIAQSANINHSLILHYFGSKDGLLLAFLTHERELIADELSDMDDPIEGFGAVATQSFDYQGYYRAVTLWAALGPNESALPPTYPIAAQLERMLDTGSQEADPSGVSLEGVRSETIAAAALAMLLGWQSSHVWLSRAFGIEAAGEPVTEEIVALSRWLGAHAAKARVGVASNSIAVSME